MKQSLGKTIRELRLEKGLTLKELGDSCEPPLDAAYVSRIENEKVTPGPEMLERIARAIGVSPRFLEEIAETSEEDLAGKIYARLIDNLLGRVENPAEWLKVFEENDREGLDLEPFLPFKFQEKERVPSPQRLALIYQILSLDKNEIELFHQILQAFLQFKQTTGASIQTEGQPQSTEARDRKGGDAKHNNRSG